MTFLLGLLLFCVVIVTADWMFHEIQKYPEKKLRRDALDGTGPTGPNLEEILRDRVSPDDAQRAELRRALNHFWKMKR